MKKQSYTSYKGKAIPRHFWGALIGSALSIGSSIIGGSQANKEKKRQMREQQASDLNQQMMQDRQEVDDLEKNQQYVEGYYQKDGGVLNTDPKKKKDTTPAQRNKLRRKAYLDKAYSMGIDTTNVSVKRGLGKIMESGSSSKKIAGRVKPTIRAHYKGNNNGTYRVPMEGQTHRFLSRGYKVEPEEKRNGGTVSSFYSTKGGKLKKLSNNTVKAVGNKHEESKIDNTSGIKLLKGKKPIAEVEGGEVIKNNKMVYSDRLKVNGNKTYADEAENLSKLKNKAKGKNKKVVSALEDLLFLDQEASKRKPGKTKVLSEGGSAVAGAMPFLDNVVNLVLTSQTPKLNKPSIQKIKKGKTKVNVTPQLASVNDAVNSSARSIANNTSNSAVARANMTSARLKGARQKANILAAKENKETALHNQDLSRQDAIVARNQSKMDAHNLRETARIDDIHKRISANAANLAQDFTDIENRKREEDFDNRRLDIVEQMYNKGTTNRAMLKDTGTLDMIKANPDKYKDRFLGTEDEEEFLRLTGYRKQLPLKARPLNTNY